MKGRGNMEEEGKDKGRKGSRKGVMHERRVVEGRKGCLGGRKGGRYGGGKVRAKEGLEGYMD